MPNKLPKFFDKHKICIICEGNEEYEYLKRLKDLNVWNEQYEVSLVNAGGNGNIPARYQDRYQNGADELVLVFCDTEKKPHEQYEDIKRIVKEEFNMSYRNANYSAFYVSEPFSESNLGANSTHDFVYYNMLRMWRGEDNSFPFNDAHDKTYNVRDGSDWEKTLKPRLHTRLDNSKNIILFLSSITANSRALREEMNYGISTKGLPVIVIYPDYDKKSDIVDSNGNFKKQIKDLWDKLPAFRDNMSSVATLHIPCTKSLITSALNDEDFMVNTMADAKRYFYKL